MARWVRRGAVAVFWFWAGIWWSSFRSALRHEQAMHDAALRLRQREQTRASRQSVLGEPTGRWGGVMSEEATEAAAEEAAADETAEETAEESAASEEE